MNRMFLSMNVALGSVVKQRHDGPTAGMPCSQTLALLAVRNSCRDSDLLA